MFYPVAQPTQINGRAGDLVLAKTDCTTTNNQRTVWCMRAVDEAGDDRIRASMARELLSSLTLAAHAAFMTEQTVTRRCHGSPAGTARNRSTAGAGVLRPSPC